MPSNPSFDCITGRHLFADVHDGEVCVGGWCLWCGTGTYDAERITDDGRTVGFTPTYRVRVPDGFHRVPADCL